MEVGQAYVVVHVAYSLFTCCWPFIFILLHAAAIMMAIFESK
jgi:hypothetical protein